MELIMEIDLELKEWLKDVVYVVKATTAERMYLWRDYSKSTIVSNGCTWKQDNSIRNVVTGLLGNYAVCINLMKANINGQWVIFVEDTSTVVDHNMIDDFLQNHLNCKNDRGYIHHSDVTNFSNVINYIDNLNKKLVEGQESFEEYTRKIRNEIDEANKRLKAAIKQKDHSINWVAAETRAVNELTMTLEKYVQDYTNTILTV